MHKALNNEWEGKTDNLFSNNRAKEFRDIDAKVKSKQGGVQKERFLKNEKSKQKGPEDEMSKAIG